MHFFIDHGGYSIGAIANSVRKLHFCSMCSKETQNEKNLLSWKTDNGAKSNIFRVASQFHEIFFYELDSVRDWQFFKYSVKTEDSTLSRVFSENVHQNINYLCRVSSDINNNKLNGVQNSVSKNILFFKTKFFCFWHKIGPKSILQVSNQYPNPRNLIFSIKIDIVRSWLRLSADIFFFALKSAQ